MAWLVLINHQTQADKKMLSPMTGDDSGWPARHPERPAASISWLELPLRQNLLLRGWNFRCALTCQLLGSQLLLGDLA
jgi:hypothetical protein